MKFGTMSIVVGGTACNARCDFCISKQTPEQGVSPKADSINWRNFDIACDLALSTGVTNVLLTSKGEPTLWPELVDQYLVGLRKYEFPLVDLQTNGLRLAELAKAGWLHRWYEKRLTTVALSIVSEDAEENRQIYTPHLDSYPPLGEQIRILHDIGFSVRLTVMMTKGRIDRLDRVLDMVAFARSHGVEQLTIRPIYAEDSSIDLKVGEWTRANTIDDKSLKQISDYFEANGTHILTLQHGAPVYDYDGQNVCLTDCLTIHPDETEEARQLIFFPDGHLRYAWQYPGAIII